ncbi:hypothetical protein ACFPPF_20235 [Xenophilus aerolatus]|nr:hypothetical protein [Xenophilus aerolatus]
MQRPSHLCAPYRAPHRASLAGLALAALGGLLAAPAASADDRTVIDNPGRGTNRIEITGNTATNVQVRCGDGRTAASGQGANVNSVNVDKRALEGRTVIVTGRNARDVKADADCAHGQPGAANVNSINIR